MKVFKNISDGFMWAQIEPRYARIIFDKTTIELYRLYTEDGSASLIETRLDLADTIERGDTICVEIGFEKDIELIP